MFIGIEIRRRKDDSGKGWYRIAPAIIQQDGDEEREARTFRGLTAGAVLAAMLIVSLMAISYTVPDPIITTETTIIGVNK
jgi:hypothetical protein